MHGGDKVSGIVAYFHFLLVELFPQRTPSFFSVAVESVLQGFPCYHPISRGTDCLALMSFHCNVS